MQDKEPVSYTLLLIVIIVGVTIGNLLSNWLTAQYAAYQIQKAAEQAGRVIQQQNERMRLQSKQAQAAQQAQIRRDRENNPLARKLAQQCNDWTRSFSDTKTAYAQQEMNRRCGQLRAYIDSGVAPRD
jgi:type II secretory pathway pseudopilin PulG